MHASSTGFYLPVKALSRVFLAKLRDRMHKAELLHQIPAEVWTQEWNVSCQAVPSAEASIESLAPCVFKVAISDYRILSFTEGRVSFSVQNPGSTRQRTLTLDALELIRRYLQHVLPTGFMKVRYHGLLSPTAKTPPPEVIAKVELASGFTLSAPGAGLAPWPAPACATYGGRLHFYRFLRARSTPHENGLGPVSVHSPAMST